MSKTHLLNQKSSATLVVLLSFVIIGVAANNIVSAVTYQTGVGVSFTFNPKLTLSLSSSNLLIPSLAPGTTGDSNEITITISTNAAYGYNLSATVGNSTTYNNTDLTHTSGSSAGKFTSIAYESNPSNYISSFTTDNTWGYSIDSGTKYNGLPLYSDTTNIATLKSTDTTPSTGTDTVNFLIGAKASTTQPTGDYNNVINFKAVTNHVPINLLMAYESAGKTKQNGYYKMQDMNSSICNMVEVEDDELQVIDTRDNKVYWIAKLRDGHCWMTQNLDLDLGVATLTHNSTTLYHDDTDLGWGTDTATQNWTPDNTTVTVDNNGTFTGWRSDNNQPSSADPGNWYYAGYDGTTLLPGVTVNYLTSANKITNGGISTVYNDANHTTAYFKNVPFTGTGTSNNGTHGHVGNYYNWAATIAVNSITSSTFSNYAQNSVCPAGWRLPTITSYSADYLGNNEYANLNYYYNNKVTNIGLGWEAAPLYYIRGGDVSGSSLYYSGNTARYWSNAASNQYIASFLGFGEDGVNPNGGTSTNYGFSIRCLAR